MADSAEDSAAPTALLNDLVSKYNAARDQQNSNGLFISLTVFSVKALRRIGSHLSVKDLLEIDTALCR